MTPRAKWAIIITLFFLAYGFAVVWFRNCLPRPYEHPPKPTKAEEKAMEKARKRHGECRQVISVQSIYCDRIGKNGKPERVWIIRKRG